MNQKNEELNAGESLWSERKRKLKFRAWHRGTREMDLLMGSFADSHLPDFGDAQLDQFEHLLTCNDPDLYDWITGKVAPPANEVSDVLTLLMGFRFK